MVLPALTGMHGRHFHFCPSRALRRIRAILPDLDLVLAFVPLGHSALALFAVDNFSPDRARLGVAQFHQVAETHIVPLNMRASPRNDCHGFVRRGTDVKGIVRRAPTMWPQERRQFAFHSAICLGIFMG